VEDRLVSAIRRHPREDPILAPELMELSGFRKKRELTAYVEYLQIVRGYPIGGIRKRPAGYFWIRNDEDWDAALLPYLAQIVTMARNFRARAPQRLVERLRLQMVEVFRGLPMSGSCCGGTS